MSVPTLTPDPAAPGFPEARPGSRAARLALPRSIDVLKNLAVEHGVCTRPITLRRTDLGTGQTELVDLPCGATREDKCVSCAKRAKRLRQVQIREGWHRRDEPHPGPQPATEGQKALIRLRAHFEFARDEAMRAAQWDQVADLDEAIVEVEQAIAAEGLRGRVAHEDQDDEPTHRRIRSTRRRQDVPDLPRQKVDPRTIGRTYAGRDGREHQPSMWLTLTLDSYGPVHGVRKTSNGRPIPCACGRWHHEDDAILGVPVDPHAYDYRRAAWDAVHLARLLDRYWQNLRRAVGWNVQYAGCVEPQRRLAPHAHFAIRGTIARTMLERVAAATYHQVWWPSAAQPRYLVDRPPTWDTDQKTWIDLNRREPLTVWQQALDAIDNDPDAEPVHVVRFGPQDYRLHHQVPHQEHRRLPRHQHAGPAGPPRPALAGAARHTLLGPVRQLAPLRHPAEEGTRQAPARQLQGTHTPESHPRRRRPPRTRLPRLVRQDPRRPPRRRPRLGPGVARRQRRSRPGPRRRRRTGHARPGHLGIRPPNRPGHAAATTPAPACHLPTHPMARPTPGSA